MTTSTNITDNTFDDWKSEHINHDVPSFVNATYNAYDIARFSGIANQTGAIVFQAPYGMLNNMHILEFDIYEYASGKVGKVLLSFYAYKKTGVFLSTALKVWGEIDSKLIRLAKNADGNIAIVFGNVTDNIAYSKYILSNLRIVHYTLPENFAENWTASLVTDLSSYTDIITPQYDQVYDTSNDSLLALSADVLKKDGTTPLTANWNAGDFTITAKGMKGNLIGVDIPADANYLNETTGHFSFKQLNSSATNLPTTPLDNANGILTMNTSTDLYGKQIGWIDNDDIYVRRIFNNIYQPWYKLWHSGHTEITATTFVANGNTVLTTADIGGTGSATTVSRTDHTHTTYDYSTTISGATVFDEIDVTDGIVTNISTRELTAANIGAEPTIPANTYEPYDLAIVKSDENEIISATWTFSSLILATNGIICRNGNNSTIFTDDQITFGYNSSSNYKHAIKTRHSSATTINNAIDFFLWNSDVDGITDVGTFRSLTLDQDGSSLYTSLTIFPTAVSSTIVLQSDTGYGQGIIFTKDNQTEWIIESCAGADVDFKLMRWVSGSFEDYPLVVENATGNITIANKLTVGGQKVIVDRGYINNYGSFGCESINNAVQDNILYAGGSRFDVTGSGLLSLNEDELFDGGEWVGAEVATNGTGVINIDLISKGEWSTSGISYAQGYIYLEFYHTSIPDSISARVKDKDNVWTNQTIIEDIANNDTYRVFRIEVTLSNYITEIELTLNAQAAISTKLINIAYIPDRAYPDKINAVQKCLDMDLYKKWSWYDDTNTVVASIDGTGTGAFNDLTIADKVVFPSSNYLISNSGDAITTGTGNCLLGNSAGLNISSGNGNIAIGNIALVGHATSKLSGIYNIGIGYHSGHELIGGDYNTLIQHSSGYNITSGTHNTFIGYRAGYYVKTPARNIGIGREALEGHATSFLSGGDNIGIGYQTGHVISTGYSSILLGYQAGFGITTAPRNIFLGFQSGYGMTTGQDNILLGYQSGRWLTDSDYNIGIGYLAMFGNATTATGNYNIAIGMQAANGISTGFHNVFQGYQAGFNISVGWNNIGIGQSALKGDATSFLTGAHNIGIGSSSGLNLTSGLYNIFLGSESGRGNTQSSYNISFGYRSMYGIATPVTGGYNFAVGRYAAAELTTGTYNIFLGDAAGYYNTTGIQNIGIGRNALSGHSTTKLSGGSNVGLGMDTGRVLTTGYENTFLGHSAGNTVTTGYRNVVIGSNAGSSTYSNTVVIGYNAVAYASNTITLGASLVGTLYCNTQTITALSDKRDKIDIEPLKIGLEFINKIEPINYRGNNRDRYEENEENNGSKANKKIEHGVVAQQVKSVMDEMDVYFAGYDDTEGKPELGMGYGYFIPVLIKAVQELDTKLEKLLKENR